MGSADSFYLRGSVDHDSRFGMVPERAGGKYCLKGNLYRFCSGDFSERWPLLPSCIDYGGGVVVDNTSIEWADATVNFWQGCEKVSPGCKHCYADNLDVRFHGGSHWGATSPRKDQRKSARESAMRLNRKAEKAGRTIKVFNSMNDWLDPAVPIEYLADMLDLVADTSHLTWLLLTKRPELFFDRMQAALRFVAEDRVNPDLANWIGRWLPVDADDEGPPLPPENVWVGASVENQSYACRRIPQLIDIPAKVRFLSMEPLLGKTSLRWMYAPDGYKKWPKPLEPLECLKHIQWVIVGGESGPGARPMKYEWVTQILDECREAGTAFFFKQWGGINKKASGRMLDGRTWNQVPGLKVGQRED